MQRAVDQLDDSVINIAKQTVVDVLESCNVDRSLTFIKGAPKSVLDKLLVLVLDHSPNITEFFENSII